LYIKPLPLIIIYTIDVLDARSDIWSLEAPYAGENRLTLVAPAYDFEVGVTL